MAEELTLDLEELHHLQSIAKRPRILSMISSEIRNLETEKQLLKDVDSQPTAQTSDPSPTPAAPTPTPTPAAPAPTPTPAAPAPTLLAKGLSIPALNYATLSSFSWDQDDEKVKIYVSLEGVDQEKVETIFKKMSVDLKFHDVQGKNYRCAIPKLNKEIVPEKSKVLVKPKRVVVTLYKASKGNWLDLHFKEDKLKPGLEKERDPMAGIMDLMKNMYEEGDEDMKRTIAKAWTDARSGKSADPMNAYR
ncbi:calcyclin-binding protein-like isoform X1 [Papaver somniferum]|uniref:calcyclin-binding protein-like isoform X1 n=1 Tax=Papaver somniferum TaxID=3469 RepID=UPI000E700074|nr:calcyclin-binding protein-like isoform X1 [Papaver somniferum]